MKMSLKGSAGIVMPVRSLVIVIAAAGLATDDPHEGSGPLTLRGVPFAAHEWEPLPGS